MKKHYRDEQGKAKPWIVTRFARAFRDRMFYFWISLNYCDAAWYAQYRLIRNAESKTPEDKVKKAMALAEATVNHAKARNRAIQDFKESEKQQRDSSRAAGKAYNRQ